MDQNKRKSIKKASFEEPKDVHIKALAIYILILSSINYVSINFINESNIAVLLSFIITIPLFLNYTKICLDSTRDILIETKDLFKIKKNTFKFSIYYTLIILTLYLLNLIFSLTGIFGLIINTVLYIYLFPIITFMPFVFLDNTSLSLKNLIIETVNLTKKNIITFYGLLFSFTLWFIIGLITLGILYLWLIPYITICITNLYLNIKKEKKFKKQKALSNKVIIIIFLIFIIIMNIISFKIYPNSFNKFKENINIVGE